MDNKPDFISVIIVAQGRKEFLRYAIDSVLDQTLDRSRYEVIVVKDFSDELLDEIIEENGILGLTVDPKSGKKLSRIGVTRSRGNILSFLDDDDLYARDRLERIMESFSDPKVGYYHNSVVTVDEEGIPTDKLKRLQPDNPLMAGKDGNSRRNLPDLFRYGASFNISSIAARRELVFRYMNYYERLPLSLDLFLFYASLISDYAIFADSRKLTYYRLHNSVSNAIGSYPDFRANREWFLKLLVDDYNLISEMVKGTEAERYSLAEGSEAKLRLNIFRQGKDRKPLLGDYTRMLKPLLPGKQFYHLELIALSITSRIAPERIRRMVYRKYMREMEHVISKKSDAMPGSV